MDEQVRVYWAKMGLELCQKKQSDLSALRTVSTHTRGDYSQGHTSNGSSAMGSICPESGYCAIHNPKALHANFLGHTKERSPFGTVGFSNWKHASERIAEYESCEMHRKVMIVYVNQTANQGTVDSELNKQFNEECEYWRLQSSTKGCQCQCWQRVCFQG